MSITTEWENGRPEKPVAVEPPKRKNKKTTLASDRAKRCLDVLSAIILLVFLLPVIGLVSAILFATNGRPVLFFQMRVGRGGKLFPCYKFRTMVNNADEVMRHHLNVDDEMQQEWSTCQKLRKDPRVHRLGAILRQSSMDELPQLLNVIRGEMSMVGPRPIVTDEIFRFGSSFEIYTRVRPGLTGLWQISGRSETTYEERVKLDTTYVLTRTLLLDLKIMMKTAKVVWSGRGSF